MKSPVYGIEERLISTGNIHVKQIFNPVKVQTDTLFLVETSNVLKNELLKLYSTWTAGSNELEHDEYDGDSLYALAPSGVHCLETFLEPEAHRNIKVETEDYVGILHNFHYVLINDYPNGKPVGFVKGSFSVGSVPELTSVPILEEDIEDIDAEGTIYIGCNIEAIELDPACRGMGYGKFIAKELNEAGRFFINTTLNQVTYDTLQGLAFEPLYTIDLHSKSGVRWSDYMYEEFEKMTFETLLNYTQPEYLKDATCDASL